MSVADVDEMMNSSMEEGETSVDQLRTRSRRSNTQSEGKSTPLKQYNLRTENAERRQAEYLKAKYSDFDMVVSPKKSSPRSQRKRLRVEKDSQEDMVLNMDKHPEPIVSVGSSRSATDPTLGSAPVVATVTSSNSTLPPLAPSTSKRIIVVHKEVLLASPAKEKPKDLAARNRSQLASSPDKRVYMQVQREHLVKLNNLLKLPQAARWVFCEFFYSEIDRPLFLGDSDFNQCVRDSFPNLKTRKLNRTQWRTIRQLIGKPRRCSAAFLAEERQALDLKRSMIRKIYEGNITSLENSEVEMPTKLCEPLAVGDSVFVRCYRPTTTICPGLVDAVMGEGKYHLSFNRSDVAVRIYPDTLVMRIKHGEMISTSYFLDRNMAAKAGQFFRSPAYVTPSTRLLANANEMGSDRGLMEGYDSSGQFTPPVSNVLKGDPLLMSHDDLHARAALETKKIGNFPLKLLMTVVQLNKLIKIKRAYVLQLQEMNSEAERITIFSDAFPPLFQSRYATILVDLEAVNKQLDKTLNTLVEMSHAVLPQLSETVVPVRPDAIQKLSRPYAARIVQHCNSSTNVTSNRAIDLITNLTALLLQIKSLGQESGSTVNSFELQALAATMAEVRKSLQPENYRVFQENVEIHLTHIEKSLCSATEADIADSITTIRAQ